MKDKDKTKDHLIQELVELRQWVAELEASEMKRKQAEQALRESEEKYRLVAESLLDIVYEFDLEGKFIYVNEVATHMFGYSKDEILSDIRVQDMMAEEDKVISSKAINDILKGKTTVGERTFIRKDGSKFIGEIHSGPIHKGKDVVGIRGILRDITERKQAEEALKESENKYRTIFENTGTGTIIIEEDTTISLANKEFEKLTGYSKEEVVGKKSWTEFVMKKDLARLKECHDVRRIDPNAAPRNHELKLIDKQGNVRDVYLTVDMIPGTNRSVASLLDITEHKRAEERLREYEARYSHLLDHMPDGVALTFRGQIIKVNPLMAQMFGFPSAERMDKRLCIWDLAAPGSKKIMRQQSTPRALGQHGENRFEFLGLRKDGSTFPAECTLTIDQSEPHRFVLVIIRDVTERKASEEQRKLLSERIMTAQERERASIARELHDELGQALTGIKIDMAWIKSHIKGTNEVVSDRFEALGNLVDTTLESVQEMAASLRPSMLDRLGLRAAIEWYAGEFERRTGIECIIESESADLNLNSNVAINVYRIFQEALTNVARHARASRVDVRIAQDQRYLKICISDNGRGIPSQELSGPMSLGIAGMRERAELIMGRLDIQSRMGKGTRVTVYLPVSP